MIFVDLKAMSLSLREPDLSIMHSLLVREAAVTRVCEDKIKEWPAVENMALHRAMKPSKELLVKSDWIVYPILHIKLGLVV